MKLNFRQLHFYVVFTTDGEFMSSKPGKVLKAAPINVRCY